MQELDSWKRNRAVDVESKAARLEEGEISEDDEKLIVEDDAILEEMVRREEKMLEQLEQIEKNQSGKSKVLNELPKAEFNKQHHQGHFG